MSGMTLLTAAARALGVPRSRLEGDVRTLIGLEAFGGAVNRKASVLHSTEAALLRSDSSCLSRGARLELAGKGLSAADRCGFETSLIG